MVLRLCGLRSVFLLLRIKLTAELQHIVKIIEKNLHQGFVKVVPDSPDDLWHLYNVIYKGDEVYAYSSRAIKSDTETSAPKAASVFQLLWVLK